MTAAIRLPLADLPTTTDAARPRLVAIEPSAQTLQVGTASTKLRDFIDALCIEYRLSPAERSVLLTGELMRGANADLAYERATGTGAPLSTRYFKPASEDRRVAEADALVDAITEAAQPAR